MFKIGERVIVLNVPEVDAVVRGLEGVIASSYHMLRETKTGRMYEGYVVDFGFMVDGLPFGFEPKYLQRPPWPEGDARNVSMWHTGPFQPRKEIDLPPRHFNCRSAPFFGVSSG